LTVSIFITLLSLDTVYICPFEFDLPTTGGKMRDGSRKDKLLFLNALTL
jgi:hypothetical protein